MKYNKKECDYCYKILKDGDIVLFVCSSLPDGYPADLEYFCNDKCFNNSRCDILSYTGMWKKIGDEEYYQDWESKN